MSIGCQVFFSLYSVSSCKSSVVLVSQLAPFGISFFTKFPEHSAIDSKFYSVSLCNMFCTWLKFGFDFSAFLTQDVQTPKELLVGFEFHHINLPNEIGELIHTHHSHQYANHEPQPLHQAHQRF